MDLPPDKAKLLKNYDDDRKWEIICDRVSDWMSCPFYFLPCYQGVGSIGISGHLVV